jgi:NAD(P)-dependent dehydrogenase (short-subunit alcohol dehydrogenase family)
LQAWDAEVMTIPCDVSDQYQVEQALGRVIRRYGQIDVIINNAGIIQVSPMEHMKIKDFEEAMGVHFWGPLYTCMTGINYMRQQGAGGRIVNIASIGGEFAVPHMLPYVASKFALVGLSEGLQAELAKDNILVTTVIPGLMRTGSHVNALFKGRHRLEYAWFSITNALPFTSTSPVKAARQILEACRYGQPVLIITPQARLLVLLRNLFPNLVARMNRFVNQLLPKSEPRWGDITRSGWESHSRWSPSEVTTLADRAVAENNELKGNWPIT